MRRRPLPLSNGGPFRETVRVAALPTAATDTAVLALGAITPPVAGPGVTVTVTGSVVARTARLADPTVRVVLGATSVVTRASVEAWAGSATAPGGIEVGTTKVGRAVDVGTSAPFTHHHPAGPVPAEPGVRDHPDRRPGA